MPKTIIENGIKVYKNHFCECPCKQRIPWMKTHSRANRGIPDFITGHQNRGENSYWFGKHHSEKWKKTVSNKLKDYHQNHPEAIEKLSEFNTGKHRSKETRDKIRKANIGNTNSLGVKRTKKTIEKMRKAHVGKHASQETRYKMIEGQKRRWIGKDTNTEQLKNARKHIKFVSKPELEMLNYIDELNIKHFPSKSQNNQVYGTPDTIIQTYNSNPIALFADGCHWHGCLECFPIKEVNHEKWKFHSKWRHKDKKINKKLTRQGFIIVRIWEHDFKNGNYKKIINELINKYPIIKNGVKDGLVSGF